MRLLIALTDMPECETEVAYLQELCANHSPNRHELSTDQPHYLYVHGNRLTHSMN